MDRFFYPIFKLPEYYNANYEKEEIPRYIKWWLYKQAKRKHNEELSDIIYGTNFSLLNTLPKKFNIFEVQGNTQQTQLTGKNLFNNNKVMTGITYNTSNDIFTFHRDSGTDFLVYYNSLNLKPNTNYNLYMNILENTMTDPILLVTSSTSYIQGTFRIEAGETGIKSAQVSTRSSTEGLLYDLWFYCTNATGNLKAQIMLVEGTTAGNYEPFCGGTASPNPEYPQVIKNVEGNVNVKIENKNLLNRQKCTENSALVWNTGVTFSENGSITTDYIPVIEGSNYVTNYMGQIIFYDKDKNYISNLSQTGFYSFIVPNDKNIKYVRVGYRTSYNTGIDLLTAKIQLEKNTTAASYVEHEEQNLPFTLENGQKLMLGDSLQDDGIHQKRKQIVFDGSNDEEWSLKNAGVVQFNIVIPNIASIAGLCDKMLCKVNYETEGKPYMRMNSGAIWLDLGSGILEEATVENLRTWLSENPLTVEYILAEEEITPYTETQATQYNAIQNAKTYNEQTNITTSSDELDPILKIQYYEVKEV